MMDCPICLDPVVTGARTLGCEHAFHEACIATWLRENPVCPVCRADVEAGAPPSPEPRRVPRAYVAACVGYVLTASFHISYATTLQSSMLLTVAILSATGLCWTSTALLASVYYVFLLLYAPACLLRAVAIATGALQCFLIVSMIAQAPHHNL